MSISDYKKPSHRRNDSDELDVFEAANYFSGYNDNHNNNNNNYYLMPQKVVNKEEKRGYLREGRVSLDVPSLKNYYIHPSMVEHQPQQQKSKDKKKYKQPSSPGGKIAQFLNSLFSQTNSKNNNKKSSSSKSLSLKDEDESPVSRRKRRSSISHFRSTSSAIDARSMYSTSSSGFRTPPPYNLSNNTPSTKSCKDSFRSFSDYKEVLSTLSKYKIQGNGNINNINNSINGISKDNYDHNNNKVVKGSSNNSIDWIDEKLRMVEKSKNYNNIHQEKNLKKENYNKKYNQHQHEDEDDDGADSDSSSDLFELRIDYDFGFCSSGLPVYETTHMDNIKRSSSTVITSVPIKT